MATPLARTIIITFIYKQQLNVEHHIEKRKYYYIYGENNSKRMKANENRVQIIEVMHFFVWGLGCGGEGLMAGPFHMKICPDVNYIH